MPDVDANLEEASTEEATGPAPDGARLPVHDTRGGIKALILADADGVLLDVEAEREQRRHGVGQVEQHRGRDDADEADVIGDGGGEDERDDPPDGHDGGVDELPALGDERRHIEDVHEDVVVQDLDADVAVQAGSNKGSDERDHVAGRLPIVWCDALITGVVAVLALEVVYEAAVDQVDAVDEELRSPHGLDEVAGPAHLGHELHEQLRAGVRQNARQQAVDRPDQATRRQAIVVHDGWVGEVSQLLDGLGVNDAASGSQGRDGVVGGRVRDDAHSDKDNQEVEPHSEVSHPSIRLERADLRDEEASDDEDHGADHVAQLELGHLRDVLAELDRDLAKEEQQAESLADVGDVSSRLAPGSHCEITIVARGEFVAVDAEEYAPDQIPRVASHEAEDGVEADSWEAVSPLCS